MITSEIVLFEKNTMKDLFGNTPLLLATRRHHLEEVKRLLDDGADANIQNEDGNTALLYATIDGDLEMVKVLLPHTNPDIQNLLGYTALMFASFHHRVDMVQMLLDAGADPNRQNRHGNTALMIAVQCGYFDIVALLWPRTHLHITNEEGKTAQQLVEEKISLS